MKLIIKKNKGWWSAFIVFLIIIQPDIFTQFRITALLFAVFDLLIFAIYFISLNKRKIPKSLFWWFVIRGYLLLIMVISGNVKDFDQWGRLTILVADVILIFEKYCYQNKSNDLISAISSVGALYLLINTITICIFPKGVFSSLFGEFYFLGTRVAFLKFVFPFVAIAYLQYIYYGSWRKFIIIVALSLYNILKFDVSTAIACMIVIVILLTFRKRLSKFVTLKFAIIVTGLLNIAFVFLNASNWFSWIIVNLLKRSVSLTNRTMIWGLALENIFDTKAGFIFGHGIVNNGSFISMYGVDWPPHNQLLGWLFEVGVIGTIALLVFLSSLDKKLDCTKDVYFIRTICFSILVSCISSSQLNSAGVYLCFIVLAYIKKMREEALSRSFNICRKD